MKMLVAMMERRRAGFHDEKEEITMALEGHKMCGTMDGANSNCVGRFPRGTALARGHALDDLSSGIRIEAYYINQASIHELGSRELTAKSRIHD